MTESFFLKVNAPYALEYLANELKSLMTKVPTAYTNLMVCLPTINIKSYETIF